MTLSNFCFTKNNHFLCVERKIFVTSVYLVFISKGSIIGIVIGKGLFINFKDELTQAKFSENKMVLTNTKPYNFISDELWDKIKNKCIFDESILKVDKDNFRIELSKITAFDYSVTNDKYNGIPLHGLLFLSTSLLDIKLDNPARKLLYGSPAKLSNNKIKPLCKRMHVVQNQATNFDATYSAVRNWLLEQNVLSRK